MEDGIAAKAVVEDLAKFLIRGPEKASLASYVELADWVTVGLTTRPDPVGDAWSIMRRRLGAQQLNDPILLAAGWLLGLRKNEWVASDTGEKELARVLPRGIHRTDPRGAQIRRAQVAAWCLRRDATWGGRMFRPNTWFKGSARDATPAARAVAAHLIVALYGWLAEEGLEPSGAEQNSAQGTSGSEVTRDTSPDIEPASGSDDRTPRPPTKEFISPALTRVLESAAASASRLPSYYPAHLTPSTLNAGRRVERFVEGYLPVSNDDIGIAIRRDQGELAVDVLPGLRRGILLGTPGIGKSTIARALVGLPDRLVVAFSARDLIREQEQSGDGLLAAVARAYLPTGLLASDHGALVSELAGLLAESPDTTIVIDGIDELLEPHQGVALDRAIDALEQIPGRLLLTSRLTEYQRRRGWEEYVLLPLDLVDFEALAKQWHGTVEHGPGAEAMSIAKWNLTVTPILQIPIVAGLFLRIVGEVKSPDVLNRASQIFGRAIGWIGERRWKQPHAPHRSAAEAAALESAYSQAAWQMALGEGSISKPHPVLEMSPRELRRRGVAVDLLTSGELLIAPGDDKLVASADRPWIWLHRNFSDYFVARHLYGLIGTDRETAARLFRYITDGPMSFWLGTFVFLNDWTTHEEDHFIDDHLGAWMDIGVCSDDCEYRRRA